MMAKRAEETEQQKAVRIYIETLTKLTKELRKVTVPKRSIKFETKKLWHLNEHQVSR